MLHKVFIVFIGATVLSLAAANGIAKKPYVPQNPKQKQAKQFDQHVTCYDRGPGDFGYEFYADQGPVENLADFGLDNYFSFCEVFGAWIFYNGQRFNYYEITEALGYAWGKDPTNGYDFAFDPVIDNQVSSLRSIGAPNGYTYPTLTLYEFENFIGTEQCIYDYDDGSTLPYDNLGVSAIVTGDMDWAIYEYDNFQGSGVCLPASGDVTDPMFYEKIIDIAGEVSSAKPGCSQSMRRLEGRPMSSVIAAKKP